MQPLTKHTLAHRATNVPQAALGELAYESEAAEKLRSEARDAAARAERAAGELVAARTQLASTAAAVAAAEARIALQLWTGCAFALWRSFHAEHVG